MKLRNVIEALPALQKLAKQDMSIKKLYKISMLMGSLEKEITFFNTQRTNILQRYCEMVEGQYVPRQDCVKEYNEKMTELLNTDIDSEICVVDIADDEDIRLSYNDIVVLKGFIRIEGD